jgi:hypothetical protein
MSIDLLYSPRIDAFVHTQGVVWGDRYVVLEFSYFDRTGAQLTALVRSPAPYRRAKCMFPTSLEPDAIVSTRYGMSYSQLLAFLAERYRLLQSESQQQVVFGYKGSTYQPNVLRASGVPCIFNVERWGLPSLAQLAKSHPEVSMRVRCPHHVRPGFDKCSEIAARLVLTKLTTFGE